MSEVPLYQGCKVAGQGGRVPTFRPLRGGRGWFINSETRPLHASEEDETRRQGSTSPDIVCLRLS